MLIKEFILESNKIKKDTCIILLNDLHISKRTKIQKYNILLDKIKDIKPDFIVFAGDIIDNAKYYDQRLITFLKNLSTLTNKVLINIGNHEESTIVKGKSIKYINESFYNELNSIDNVMLLEEYQNNIYNINFLSLTLDSIEHYKIKKENKNHFIKSANESLPKNIKNSTYNILLCHTPINIMNQNTYSKINISSNLDLVLSGHMHNGCVPYFIEKPYSFILKIFKDKYHNNRGFISPGRSFFPKLSRNKVNIIDKVTGIIGAPVTTISENYKLLSKIANNKIIFPIAINKIIINKIN